MWWRSTKVARKLPSSWCSAALLVNSGIPIEAGEGTLQNLHPLFRTARRLKRFSCLALFLPFGCNKEQQTSASVGTRRRSKIVESTRDEAVSGNTRQTPANHG